MSFLASGSVPFGFAQGTSAARVTASSTGSGTSFTIQYQQRWLSL